jgi:AcrR family transcriptional regulator
MARPREFDRDTAVERAMSLFWAKGFAATSTDDLLRAMKIGRQSMYDSFGDKRRLYLEAMARYQQESVAAHVKWLRSTKSPLAGIEALLLGLVTDDKAVLEKGCMGVGAVAEFGSSDAELVRLRAVAGKVLRKALVERLEAAKAAGEIRKSVDVEGAAAFVETTMQGLRVGAKAGMGASALRNVVAFAIAGLRNR